MKACTRSPRRTRNRGWLDGVNDLEPDDSESDFAEILFRNPSVNSCLTWR